MYYKKIIENYLKENNIDYNGARMNKTKLKELIIDLKEKYKVSFRKMEQEIGVSRETIRKIYYE